MTELTVNPTQMTQLINTHTEVRLSSYYKSLPYCRRRYQIFKCWMKIENGIAGNWRSNDKVKKLSKLPRNFTFFLNPYEFPRDFNIHFLLVPSTLIIFLGGRGSDWKNGAQFAVVNPFWLFSLFSTMGILFARVDLHNGNPSIRWNARAPIVIGVYIHHRNEFPFYWFPLVTFRFTSEREIERTSRWWATSGLEQQQKNPQCVK